MYAIPPPRSGKGEKPIILLSLSLSLSVSVSVYTSVAVAHPLPGPSPAASVPHTHTRREPMGCTIGQARARKPPARGTLYSGVILRRAAGVLTGLGLGRGP